MRQRPWSAPLWQIRSARSGAAWQLTDRTGHFPSVSSVYRKQAHDLITSTAFVVITAAIDARLRPREIERGGDIGCGHRVVSVHARM